MFQEKLNCIADMMEEFMKRREENYGSQFDNDPIAKLRARELDLQAQENARKKQEGFKELIFDKMRAYDESTKSRRKTFNRY